MPIQITRSQLANLSRRAGTMTKRAGRLKDKTEKTVNTLVSTAEVSAASFAFGVVQGRFGQIDVVGVPLELGSAVLLHLLGFIGVAGKAARHVHSFADGTLAAYLTSLARGIGMDMKKKALGAAVSGTGERLTEADLEALARAARTAR